MFEQESYNAAPAKKPQEGDLFYNYERTNWDLGPRIYKILAISAVLNLAVIGFIAQSDLLTRKGCDSPWVGRVCQVLDMAYVGAMLFGTERDYVDAEYEKIDLGDSEITFIDVSGVEPQFQYPYDYFKLANPEQYAEQQALQDPMTGYNPTLPNPTFENLLGKAPQLPRPNPNAVTGTIPDSPFSVDDGASNPPIRRKGRNGRITVKRPPAHNANTDQTVAQSNSNTNANNTVSQPVSSVEINKRPMVDLGNFINELREKKEVNLESQFIFNAKGKLDKNGRFDPKTFKMQGTSDDAKIIEVVQESLEAINVAGYLQHLKELSGKDVGLVLQQDATNLSAAIQSEMETDSRAKAIKSTLDLAISIAKMSKTGANATQNDKDDLLLLESALIEVDGKKVTIKFVVPKTVAHPMIQRKLAERAAENKKPNGQTGTKQNDNTALK